MPKRDIRERFLSKIKIDSFTGCWIWDCPLETNGYGKMTVERISKWAHRLAYELFIGSIPEGLDLDHLCRIRSCVNPEHLEPVTRRENSIRGDCGMLNRSKQSCINGHPFSGDNVYLRPGNRGRDCKECLRKRRHRYDLRKKMRGEKEGVK